MRYLRYFVLLALLGALVVGSLWWAGRPERVSVTEAYIGSAADIVYATAIVEPVNWAKVTSLLRERIVSLCGCEGMPVTKGKQLAELDSGDARATLAELKARQSLAKSESDRALQLLERRVVSQHVYDQAQSELSQINALIAAQTERLRDYTITAPMDGIVLRQDGSVGEVLEPGEIIFWIGQPKPLQLVAEVNEEDIPKVQTGQMALVRADAFPAQNLSATVSRITPKGDPILKNYRVYLDLPDDTPLRIGMTTEINIVTREKPETLLVPVAALSGGMVQTITGEGTLSRRKVTTGITGTRSVEVLEGLSEGDAVVMPFRDDLQDGEAVVAVSETSP